MTDEPAPHPGVYFRETVLNPRGLTVTAAARLLGVGRPALSAFLNGRAATSPGMARRIEVAFKLPAGRLLQMQTAYDAACTAADGAPPDAHPYVVPFMQIKARDIEKWVERNIEARRRLAVFLRTLVNTTARGISRIDFPGNDDAERPGWDGYAEADQASPWVPRGKSGWEFGTNEDPRTKADHDFEKSIRATTTDERLETTFVFVTPRRWPGKQDWLASHRTANTWKDVRAYDSSDLEQWLEQSIAAQVWFSGETQPARGSGTRSLDRVWADWSHVCQPPLPHSLFKQAIESAAQTIAARLTDSSNAPIVIGADSTEESLAFVARAFSADGCPALYHLRDQVIVFDAPDVLPQLAQGGATFIAVTSNREVERELGSFAGMLRCILLYPSNTSATNLTVRLEPLSFGNFELGLQEMGKSRDEIARLDAESGRSLTILRRRLAAHPEVQRPPWASQHDTARALIPLMFAGAWNSQNPADRTILSALAGNIPYETLEEDVQRFAAMDHAPLWSVGSARGVTSKMDLLFGVSDVITADHLERFYSVARARVLGEDDPGLDLPPSERWAASIFGKSRQVSRALRDGVAETLVLLAVHGNYRFRSKVGFDCAAAGNRLIRDVLTPLTARKLEANSSDLTAYAEAAPETFLDILDSDLEGTHPESLALLRPADTGPFGNCPRSGLLWALESLAWNPATMLRSVLVLGRLAQVEITDNWTNTPLRSLAMIFEARMPQTAASNDERMEALRILSRRFPATAWKLCAGQIALDHYVLHYSAKPRWRTDAVGHGEPLRSSGPVVSFLTEVFELMLKWPEAYSAEMMADLVRCVPHVSVEHQARLWRAITEWAHSTATDFDKAAVQTEIRSSLLGRRARLHRAKESGVRMVTEARRVYDLVMPGDLLARHGWLFREPWLDTLLDHPDSDPDDYHALETRIEGLRLQALREIIAQRGVHALTELAARGSTAYVIGSLAARRLYEVTQLPGVILEVMRSGDVADAGVLDNLTAGIVRNVQPDSDREALLKDCRRSLSMPDYVRLLRLAPFESITWRLVDALPGEARFAYWRSVNPDWMERTSSDLSYGVEQLLGVQRPRAAFASVRYQIGACDAELLYRVLEGIARGGDELPGQFLVDQHELEEAFVRIDAHPAFSVEQKAVLEFAFIDALSNTLGPRGSYGIPNVERHMESHPDLFVQAIAWAYKRDDGGGDPEQLRVPDGERQAAAERGYHLIHALRRIPGHNDRGELTSDALLAWIRAVRERCFALGRSEVGDLSIGQVLASAPLGVDGVWPCEPVRDALEDVRSRAILRGMATGRFNARGATWRGEGGDQERALASGYRLWASALKFTHPFVSSELLMQMAKSYEHDATREDLDALVRRRLS